MLLFRLTALDAHAGSYARMDGQGKNAFTQLKGQSLLTLEEIVRVITHPAATVEARYAYTRLLTNLYAQSEVRLRCRLSVSLFLCVFVWVPTSVRALVCMADRMSVGNLDGQGRGEQPVAVVAAGAVCRRLACGPCG